MNATMTDELQAQQRYSWSRAGTYTDYNTILGHYQVLEALRHIRGTRALDLGCGDGFLTAMLRPHFQTIIGVDAAAGHLEQARQRLPDVEFHQALIEDVRIDGKFDTVFLLDVLQQVIDPQAIIRKAIGYLAPDGVLIAQVPNANAINRRLAVLMGTLEACDELSPFDLQVVGRRHSFTMASFQAQLSQAGLNILETGGIFYKILSGPQMNWFLQNGLWDEGGFGWGRVGAEPRDWKAEFCRACYELGKQQPEDCNILYAVAQR